MFKRFLDMLRKKKEEPKVPDELAVITGKFNTLINAIGDMGWNISLPQTGDAEVDGLIIGTSTFIDRVLDGDLKKVELPMEMSIPFKRSCADEAVTKAEQNYKAACLYGGEQDRREAHENLVEAHKAKRSCIVDKELLLPPKRKKAMDKLVAESEAQGAYKSKGRKNAKPKRKN